MDTETGTKRFVRMLRAVADGMASVGWIYGRTITPRRYPEGYDRDMRAIGGDMWRAIARVDREIAEKGDAEIHPNVDPKCRNTQNPGLKTTG